MVGDTIEVGQNVCADFRRDLVIGILREMLEDSEVGAVGEVVDEAWFDKTGVEINVRERMAGSSGASPQSRGPKNSHADRHRIRRCCPSARLLG